MSFERIREEYNELSKDPITNCGMTVGLVNENSYKDWRVTITGPKDYVYRDGFFFLNVHIPDNYPNQPPEVCFITPIYHLNVNPKAPKNKEDGFHKLGNVCISTLNWWRPEYKIREVLLNIYLLFYFQNPESAYGIDRAKEYNDSDGISFFYEKAKYFTKKYAFLNNSYKDYDAIQDWDFNI